MYSNYYNNTREGLDLNEVLITITKETTTATYLSRSYPDRDFDNNGKDELYHTPIYKVLLENHFTFRMWKALRFMPYWNDPKSPYSKYPTAGWVNAGLSSAIDGQIITNYNPNYATHNMYSDAHGAIQIKNNFLIHAGPATEKNYGWGAAGCIEIIGNFNKFKEDIKILANSKKDDVDEALLQIVASRKLLLTIEADTPPDFRKKLYKEFTRRR